MVPTVPTAGRPCPGEETACCCLPAVCQRTRPSDSHPPWPGGWLWYRARSLREAIKVEKIIGNYDKFLNILFAFLDEGLEHFYDEWKMTLVLTPLTRPWMQISIHISFFSIWRLPVSVSLQYWGRLSWSCLLLRLVRVLQADISGLVMPGPAWILWQEVRTRWGQERDFSLLNILSFLDSFWL